MTFGGANYIAILAAAVAAYLAGAIYYYWLGPVWMKAARLEPQDAKMSLPLMVTGFVCELVMAWVMAGIIGHFGDVSVKTGLISAILLWIGFIATTQVVNHRYQGFGWNLTVIDSLHWLVVVLIMGAIIGGFGL